MTYHITAAITARGADSCIPDKPDAVDATVFCDGDEAGEVTLCLNHHGDLDVWGTLDMWASDALRAWLGTKDEDDHHLWVDEVVAAVQREDR